MDERMEAKYWWHAHATEFRRLPGECGFPQVMLFCYVPLAPLLLHPSRLRRWLVGNGHGYQIHPLGFERAQDLNST